MPPNPTAGHVADFLAWHRAAIPVAATILIVPRMDERQDQSRAKGGFHF
jgi:hypothetical protein